MKALEELRNDGMKEINFLFHCYGGRNRSGAIVVVFWLAYLKKVCVEGDEMQMEKLLAELVSKRSCLQKGRDESIYEWLLANGYDQATEDQERRLLLKEFIDCVDPKFASYFEKETGKLKKVIDLKETLPATSKEITNLYGW